MLRAIQAGLHLNDLDSLEVGDVLDIATEASNDTTEYKQVASQEDFDKF